MNTTTAIEPCRTYNADEVTAALARALAPLGGMEAFAERGKRVLLKPNLLAGKDPERAVTTHPAVVEAVARMALNCGAQVWIGDSPPIVGAHRVAAKCGIGAVAERLGVPVLNLERPTRESRRGQTRTRGIASPAIDADLLEMDAVINLPKMKAHCQMRLTGAVKNLFGCVPARRKAYWHFKLREGREAFARMLLALSERIAPELTVVDAVTAMEGFGPGNGDPVHAGLLIAGTNPVALDRVISEIVRVDARDHYVVQAAAELGMPGAALEDIELSGIRLEDAKLDSFFIPEPMPIGFSIPHLVKGMVRYAIHRWRGARRSAAA